MKKYLILCLALFFMLQSASIGSATEQELIAGLAPLKSMMTLDQNQRKLAELLEKSLKYYEALKNYHALFYKMEKEENIMGPTEKIFLKFEKPWKIYLGWLNTDKKGLQVAYERGKNDGKLAIHKPGLLSALVPVIFLEQSSPWVKQGSASYDIEDAGIGTFLTSFTKAVIKAKQEKRLKIQFQGKAASDGLKGEQWEVTFLNSKENSGYFAYRINVIFDEQTALPVHMELYDWKNKPMGLYEYRDLKVNLSADPEFEKQIDANLLKVYNSSK